MRRGVALNGRPESGVRGGVTGPNPLLGALPQVLDLLKEELHVEGAQFLRFPRYGEQEQGEQEKNRRLHGLLQGMGEQDLLPIPATDQKDFSLLHSPFEDLEGCSGALEAHFKRCR